MYCPNCGAKNDDNAYTCTGCNQVLPRPDLAAASAGGPPPIPVNIPNYLVPAILVTVLCCLPLGIPAIVFAAQVNGKVAAGDLEAARRYSKNAKLFTWLSFGLGLVVGVLYFVLVVAGTLLQNR